VIVRDLYVGGDDGISMRSRAQNFAQPCETVGYAMPLTRHTRIMK